MDNLQSIKFDLREVKLSVIDQLKIPRELVYVDVLNQQMGWDVIREMKVRGAPLIAIVAALSLAVDINSNKANFSSPADVTNYILKSSQFLRTSRPTAAPLFLVMDQLDNWAKEKLNANVDCAGLIDGFIQKCFDLLQQDLNGNLAIGNYGADYLQSIIKRPKLRVLTICNTGSLATAGHGTALGIIRTLHARGVLEHVYACETRPYNQGARLTAFEIVHDNLPGTLIPDSAASSLMSVKGVDAVIVGADRVTANGGNY
jgi:S-methyl-5-thioribose-1-phosphate isomerase